MILLLTALPLIKACNCANPLSDTAKSAALFNEISWKIHTTIKINKISKK